jgi:hypothetical protein
LKRIWVHKINYENIFLFAIISASGILTHPSVQHFGFFLGNLDVKFSEEEKLLYFENVYLRTAMCGGPWWGKAQLYWTLANWICSYPVSQTSPQ